jgi:hypothetical protein
MTIKLLQENSLGTSVPKMDSCIEVKCQENGIQRHSHLIFTVNALNFQMKVHA